VCTKHGYSLLLRTGAALQNRQLLLSFHHCRWYSFHYHQPLFLSAFSLVPNVCQWGVVGPCGLFSHCQLYYGLVFFLTAGAATVAPLIQWILHKRFKTSFLKYLNFPAIFPGLLTPPATPVNYVAWLLICFLFNYVICRCHIDWWLKCNCGYLSHHLTKLIVSKLCLACSRCFVRWIGCGLRPRIHRHLFRTPLTEAWHGMA
jgi:hypothetical protein